MCIIYCIYYNLLRGVAEANPSSFNFASQLPVGLFPPPSQAGRSSATVSLSLQCCGQETSCWAKANWPKKTWRPATIPKRWRIMAAKPTWAIGCTRDVGDTCLIKPSPPPPPPPPPPPQQPRQPQEQQQQQQRQQQQQQQQRQQQQTQTATAAMWHDKRWKSAWLTSGNETKDKLWEKGKPT